MKIVGLILYIEVFTSKILINDRYAVHQVWVFFWGGFKKCRTPKRQLPLSNGKLSQVQFDGQLSVIYPIYKVVSNPYTINPVGISLTYLQGKKTNDDYDSFLK